MHSCLFLSEINEGKWAFKYIFLDVDNLDSEP